MKEFGSKVAEALNDASITSIIKAKYLADIMINIFDISVKTEHGVVILNGEVPNKQIAERAISIARNTDGVLEIIDNLTTPIVEKRE